MHRTNRVFRLAFCGVLLGLTGAVLAPAAAQGQPKEAAPPGGQASAVIVPLGSPQRLQMTTKRPIKNVDNPSETVVRVQPLARDPNTVLVVGLEPGMARVTLTDADGVRETFDILVQFDIEYLRGLLRRAMPTANIQPIPGANNTVILTGTVASAEDVDVVLQTAQSVVGPRVINAARVGGVQQVQLDVTIARVSRSEIRRMSFEFLNVGQQHVLSNGFGALFLPSEGISGTLPAAPVIRNTISTVNGAPANIFFGIFTPTQDFFGFLQALRDENVVKTLAEPKLVALSGRQASFLSGGEQAIPVPAGLGQVGVQFEEFGTRLNFLPIVLGNGKIHLEVEPEVSNLDNAAGTVIQGTVVPGRATQRVHTTVQMEAGQTLAIGGLIQRETLGTTRKVPISGDLPYLGAAFSSKRFDEIENELVILVTPRLVDPMSCDQVPLLLPGEESRSPDDYELFLEGILEAPRGPRHVKPGGRYKPAYKNDPTAGQFPCAGNGDRGHGLFGRGACRQGACGANGACGTTGAAPCAGTGHGGHAEVPLPNPPVAAPSPLPPADVLPTAGTAGQPPVPDLPPVDNGTPAPPPPTVGPDGGQEK